MKEQTNLKMDKTKNDDIVFVCDGNFVFAYFCLSVMWISLCICLFLFVSVYLYFHPYLSFANCCSPSFKERLLLQIFIAADITWWWWQFWLVLYFNQTIIILIFFTKGLSELPFWEELQILHKTIKLQRLMIKSLCNWFVRWQVTYKYFLMISLMSELQYPSGLLPNRGSPPALQRATTASLLLLAAKRSNYKDC